MSKRLLLVATMVSVFGIAQAADFPKRGSASYTTTYINTSSNVLKLGERTFSAYDSSGVTRNDDGGAAFDNMGTRCVGLRDSGTGEALNRGSCVDIDSDGDQVFSTYEAKGNNGSHVFIGGTGKYAGITGRADYVSRSIKSPEGSRNMVIVTHKATWSSSTQ